MNIKWEKPNLTIKLLLLLLISTILIQTGGMFIEIEIARFFMLYTSNLYEPLNWYRFLTYPFAGSLFSWIGVTSVILPAGYIIEKRTCKRNLVLIILISTILGGLLFTLVNRNDGLNRSIASPGLIAWGFWITAITCGIINWKLFQKIEKAIIIFFVLSVFKFDHADFGYFIAQIGVVAAVLAFILVFKVFVRKSTGFTAAPFHAGDK
jgi:membrane associated rhomboid family serine protease